MIHIHTIQHGYPGRQVIRATKFVRGIKHFLHNYCSLLDSCHPSGA